MLHAAVRTGSLVSEVPLETAAVLLDGVDRLLRIVEPDVNQDSVIVEAILAPALRRFDRAPQLDLLPYDPAALLDHLRHPLQRLLLFLPSSV